jgi:hypothetical protein
MKKYRFLGKKIIAIQQKEFCNSDVHFRPSNATTISWRIKVAAKNSTIKL